MPTTPLMPLVGRDAELAALGAALDAAVAGHGSVHVVSGEGGIGKTRLAQAVGELARTRGFTSIVGRAYPVETGIPYALFADAFVPLLRGRSPSSLQVLARGGTTELEVLFPALREEGAPLRGGDVSDLKPRLLDSFARLLQRLAAREPLLITLENLHWADPSSLELLHFVGRGAGAHPLILLCTYADEQRDTNPMLRSTERSLQSLGALTPHRLPPLSCRETSAVVSQMFGVPAEAVGDFVTLLHDRTRGNPFFMEETLKALVATGRIREEEGRWVGWSTEALEMPRTIRDALAERLDRLGPDARHVATITAVVGTQVPHPLLVALSELESPALLTAVEELRRERVIVETEADGRVAYEFLHPLLQEVLYAELSRERARALHAEIAEALETLFGDRAAAHADALAVHFLRAASSAQAPRACRYLTAAGRSALERGANREASEALQAALALAEHLGDAALEGALTLSESVGDASARETLLDLLARARQRLGDYARAADLWKRAVALAQARGDDRRVASLERRLGVAAFWSGRYDDALTHYGLGLDAADRATDDSTAARLRLARGAALMAVGSADEAEEEARCALAIAVRVGEPRLLSRVHQALQSLAIWRGPSELAREHGQLALSFATAAGDRGAEWTARWGMAIHAGLTGDVAGTRAHHEAATALAEELRSPLFRLWSGEVGIEYRSGIGEWDEALALADRTIADARAFGQRTLLPRLLVWSSLVHLGRGDFERAKEQIDEAWDVSGAEQAGRAPFLNVHTVVPAHVGRAAFLLAKGAWREAVEVGERGLELADQSGYVVWAIHRLMPLIAEASLWLKDWRRAERYGVRLRESSQRLGHPLGLAWADACDALVRSGTGDRAGAVAVLRRAADGLDAIPFVEHAARLRLQLAYVLVEAGDPDTAVVELRRLHEVFARLGARPALDDVRRRLRALGVRPPGRTSAPGAAGLTARETEIARLIAERKSNKEIAAALDISSRTVGTHLANIFAKLGVDSRGALTDLVRAGALEGPAPAREASGERKA